jgi:hypothetical protein
MNRYFIFKKVRNVNTDKIAKIIDMENKMIDKIEDKIMDELEKKTNVEEEKVKPIIKKIKKPKIVLQKFEEVSANPIPVTGEKTIIIQKPKLVIR